MKKIIFILTLIIFSLKIQSQNCYYAINLNGSGNYHFTDPYNISACGGQSVPLVATGNNLCPTGYTPVYWYSTTPNSTGSNYFSYTQGVSVIPSGQTIYIRKTPTSANQPQSVKLNVCGYPAAKPTISGATNLCSSNSLSTTYSGATTWTLTPSTAGVLTNNNNGTCTIAWSPSFIGTAQLTGQNSTTCCGLSTPSDPLIINKYPIPTSPTANNSGIACEGDTLTLTASTVTNATYSWSGPNSFTSTEQNPVLNNISLSSAGTYTVTANINGCSSTPATTVVNVNKAIVNSNGPVCEGSPLTLTASNIPNASYFWTGPNGFTSTLQNPTVSSSSSQNMSGTYQCYTTINSCTSPFPATVDVNIIQRPLAPVVANSGPVCVGQAINLVASTVPDATYNWTGPNGFTSTLQNPNVTNSATLTNAGTYNLTITKNGCTSNVSSTIVEINKTTASNNGPVCSGQQLILNATNVTGATYSWTGPNGFTSNQQNPVVNSSANSSMNGVYTVTSTVNNCTSSPSVTIVNVVNGPATPTISQNGNTLTSSSVSGNQWYNQNGPIVGATNQTFTPTVSGSYYVVVTSSGCSSSSLVINFNVLSIDENEIVNSLKIYPNPTSSEINLEFNSNINFESGNVSIFNLVSQEVYTENLHFENGFSKFNVNLPIGIYLLKLNSKDKKITIIKKITIKN